MANIIRIKRRLASSNDPSPPQFLAPGELAYNEVTNILYYGGTPTAEDTNNIQQNSTLETSVSTLS